MRTWHGGGGGAARRRRAGRWAGDIDVARRVGRSIDCSCLRWTVDFPRVAGPRGLGLSAQAGAFSIDGYGSTRSLFTTSLPIVRNFLK